MKNYPLWLAFLCCFLLVVLVGCREEKQAAVKFAHAQELNQQSCLIGGESGTVALREAQKQLPNAAFVEYGSVDDIYAALAAGKIHAMVFDRSSLEYAMLKHPDFFLLPDKLAEGHISIGTALKNQALIDKVNAFIRQYRADGTYDEMYTRWIKTRNTVMPNIPEAKNPSGTLVIGVDCSNVPMNFFDQNQQATGFDIEFARRLGYYLNLKCKFKVIKYDALFAACASGKIDLAIAQMDATSERMATMLFSEPYIDSPVSLMIRKEDYSGGPVSVVDALNRPEMQIGVPLGAAAMTTGEKIFKKSNILYFNSLAEGYLAVQCKKIDAFIFDRHSMMYVAKNNPELKLLPEDIGEEHIVVGLPKHHVHLLAKVNEFIRKFRADGTYNDMYQRWCETANPPPMPEIPRPLKPTAKLKVGTEGLNEPMNFYGADGKLTGFDIEFIKRLALFLNAELEVEAMTYSALIPAAESGKIDLLIANLNGTAERKEKMLVSDDYIDSAISVMVHADRKIGGTQQNNAICSLQDLKGKKAASLTGTGFQPLTDPLQTGIIHVFFNDNNSSVEALRSKKVDAVLFDEPIAQLYAARFPDELRFVCVYAKDFYGYAFAKGSPLALRATKVIQELKRSGELSELIDKWCKGDASAKTLATWTHKKDYNGKNGRLRFASDPVIEPMCYIGNDGTAIGLDVELVRRIAYELNMTFEFIPISFSSLIESLVSGKTDVVGGSMSITEERKKKVDFSECYYEGGFAILAGKTIDKPLPAESNELFFMIGHNLKQSFERTFVRENRWKLILQGLKITVLITILSAVFGTLLAFPICFMRRSGKRIWRWLGSGYVSLMQGTPILVVLMILYYVIFAKIDIDAVLVAVIGFGLNFAAYAGEMLRTGIDAVPRGQTEAALALGFSPYKTFFKVVLPQALRQILPVYRGEFINMLKTTSIVGYIAIQDLTKMSDIIRSRTYEAFFPLIVTAVIYFAVAWLLASGLSVIEYKLNPDSRRKFRKGGVR